MNIFIFIALLGLAKSQDFFEGEPPPLPSEGKSAGVRVLCTCALYPCLQCAACSRYEFCHEL